MNTMSRARSLRMANGGAALVIVLAILVLVAGFSVALLNLAVTQRQSAATFLANSKTRQLGDTAVGIVQAQINHATTQGATVAWASQPGMVRTYTTSGNLDKAYKLYSATSLTETNPASLVNDLPPGDWASSPALWTDINAPVVVGGRSVYPIVDPGILDLPTNSVPLGFSITSAPGSTSSQRAPMPVKWLYILEDGQIVAPIGSGNSVTVAGATAQNPVVGRIAFWTDDESCKVNLNTAGAGSLWDTPRFYSTEEVNFANSQPLNGEFQRYPGHPAMTSLSAVFPDLTDQQILSSITPRYQWGGSQQGAVNTYDKTDALNGGVLASAPLYTDTDEIAFKSSYTDRSLNSLFSRSVIERTRFFLTTDSHSPEVNLFNLPRVSCWPVATASDKRTAFDQVIALAASIGSYPYYFQRANALSPTEDYSSIQRNKDLFGYLQYLTSQKIPGFGVKLADKFGADNDQILTEVWDYIRSTNLYDTRLAVGKQFTAEPGAQGNGYGYVVPLETGNASDPNRGFGRSLTLTKLAFVFICTADPVDTQSGQDHPYADGMLHSNDPTKNKTLGNTALTSTQRRVQMMILPQFFSPSMGNVWMSPKNVRVTIAGLNNLTLAGTPLFSASSASSTTTEMRFNSGWHRRSLGGTFDYRAVFGGSTGYTQSDPGILDTPNYPLFAYPWISKFVTVPVPNPGTASPGAMTFGTGPLTVTLQTSTDGTNWTTSQVITITPPASSSIPIPNLVRVGTGASGSGTGATAATPAQTWWAFSYTSPWTGGTSGRLANLIGNPGYYKISGGVPVVSYTDSAVSGTVFREAEDSVYYTDVVREMGLVHGDARLVAGLRNVPSEAFSPLGNWSSTAPADALMHTLSAGLPKAMYVPGGSQFRRHFVTTSPALDESVGAGGQFAPDFRSDASTAILNAVNTSGDFDNGLAFWPDGAFINKPDEGNIYSSGGSRPYFDSSEYEKLNSVGFFSPNRIMPGPGMFGSLPTHLRRYQADAANPEKYAWRTLLFRKQPSHPNAVTVDSNGIPTSAPDHLLMDLFWMPTVEPYAISEPFTSDGKVNMNYQIQPFTYIKRATGLYAVLKAEKIPAVENTDTNYTNYKALMFKGTSSPPPASASYRLDLDVPTTLSQFDTRFAATSGRLFLSPSELCDLWLVPQGQSLGTMETFWKSRNLTGDNMRERPYTTIIPRLTTKSNTFTVYYRVQSLRQPRSAAGGTWSDATGTVSGEYRGSATIQRFIDLNNTTLLQTDFATSTANRPTLDTFYRWRVLSSKQFAP
ncbi:hypothetical protein DB345_16840 [Spartobacteria bacterium LR76]|nr:hypothetical protein DB345_16840 [Spartobacteria bacterium LR76]